MVAGAGRPGHLLHEPARLSARDRQLPARLHRPRPARLRRSSVPASSFPASSPSSPPWGWWPCSSCSSAASPPTAPSPCPRPSLPRALVRADLGAARTRGHARRSSCPRPGSSSSSAPAGKSGPRRYLAFPLFWLAFFTRQNALIAPAAVLLHLLLGPDRTEAAVRATSSSRFPLARPLRLLVLATSGEAWRHLVPYTGDVEYEWPRMVESYGEFPLIGVAAPRPRGGRPLPPEGRAHAAGPPAPLPSLLAAEHPLLRHHRQGRGGPELLHRAVAGALLLSGGGAARAGRALAGHEGRALAGPPRGRARGQLREPGRRPHPPGHPQSAAAPTT